MTIEQIIKKFYNRKQIHLYYPTTYYGKDKIANILTSILGINLSRKMGIKLTIQKKKIFVNRKSYDFDLSQCEKVDIEYLIKHSSTINF